MFVKILQNYAAQVREVINADFGVADEAANIIACSDETKIGSKSPEIFEFIQSSSVDAAYGSLTLKKLFSRNKLDFVVFVFSRGDTASRYLSLASLNIAAMKASYDERYDKNNFIASIMTDKLQAEDIPARAKELHIAYNAFRIVMIVRTEGSKESCVHEVIHGLFPNRGKDFIITLDRERTVLVRELKANNDYKEVERTAHAIADTLSTELMIKSYIGIGTIVDNIMDISRSFSEAQTSLTIGRTFAEDKCIYSYSNLGVGRLVYHIPEENCRLFMNEYFRDEAFDFSDAETMLTIQKFFENNLNISETARQLFVHRNTLVYRLDKIQKSTGLDLRNFDDAITFKVAMLVKTLLDNKEKTKQ
ncbi:MAG: helix-turn-helix domain-containing protein [Clostridia bacterium]|nr:helix-turn-helix domain-containing protein [Clostridia bacterium]